MHIIKISFHKGLTPSTNPLETSRTSSFIHITHSTELSNYRHVLTLTIVTYNQPLLNPALESIQINHTIITNRCQTTNDKRFNTISGELSQDLNILIELSTLFFTDSISITLFISISFILHSQIIIEGTI